MAHRGMVPPRPEAWQVAKTDDLPQRGRSARDGGETFEVAVNELKEWPLSLLVAAVCMVGGFIALSISAGCLFDEPGLGWLVFAVGLLYFAKQSNDIYQEEKEKAKEANL